MLFAGKLAFVTLFLEINVVVVVVVVPMLRYQLNSKYPIQGKEKLFDVLKQKYTVFNALPNRLLFLCRI